MNIGDYVVHNTFPPVEGYVSMMRPSISGVTSVAVMQSTGNLFWDDDNTWDITRGAGGAEQSTSLEETDVIDVEYTIVEGE